MHRTFVICSEHFCYFQKLLCGKDASFRFSGSY